MTTEREPLSGLENRSEHLSSLVDRRRTLHAEWIAREDRFDPANVSPEIAIRRLQRHAAMEVIIASHVQELASTQEQIKVLEDEPRFISKAEQWRTLVALRESQREEFVRFSTEGRISAALTHRWEQSFITLYDQPKNDPGLQRGLELLEEKERREAEQRQGPEPQAPVATPPVEDKKAQALENIAEIQGGIDKGILVNPEAILRAQEAALAVGGEIDTEMPELSQDERAVLGGLVLSRNRIEISLNKNDSFAIKLRPEEIESCDKLMGEIQELTNGVLKEVREAVLQKIERLFSRENAEKLVLEYGEDLSNVLLALFALDRTVSPSYLFDFLRSGLDPKQFSNDVYEWLKHVIRAQAQEVQAEPSTMAYQLRPSIQFEKITEEKATPKPKPVSSGTLTQLTGTETVQQPATQPEAQLLVSPVPYHLYRKDYRRDKVLKVGEVSIPLTLREYTFCCLLDDHQGHALDSSEIARVLQQSGFKSTVGQVVADVENKLGQRFFIRVGEGGRYMKWALGVLPEEVEEEEEGVEEHEGLVEEEIELQPDTARKIFILSEAVMNRLQGKQRELAEIVNRILADKEKVNLTKEEIEEEIIRNLYGFELESGLKPFDEARDNFLDIRRELNRKLEAIQIRLTRENIFESDTPNDFLIELNPKVEESKTPELTPFTPVEGASFVVNPTAGQVLVESTEVETPGRKELARRERLEEASRKMEPIIATLASERSGFFDMMPPQVFRSLARGTFGRNLDDKLVNGAIRGKFIRPTIPAGKNFEHYSFAEQAVLVYVALHGTSFVNTDGRNFVMEVATTQLIKYKEQREAQKRGKNGQRN